MHIIVATFFEIFKNFDMLQMIDFPMNRHRLNVVII